MDNLDRIQKLALALMMGDHEAAAKWLQTPLAILNNQSPLEHASTEQGAKDVKVLINRLRHGVFS